MKATIEQTDYQQMMQEIGQRAKAAARILAIAPAEQKNAALTHAAALIRTHLDVLIRENARDMENAKNLDAAMMDRLKLNPARIESMAAGLETIAQLDDPVGKTLAHWDRPNGLHISRVSVPLGVIGIIYESRPNVTADSAGLCIKSGNAVILRGGSESTGSSAAIVTLLHQALREAGLPEDAVLLVPTKDRQAVGEMLKLTDYIDVIIPRGGESLTKRVAEESRVPTLLHLTGNCHTYIHASADIAMACDVVANAKMRRTGVCGATESVVMDSAIAPVLLHQLVSKLSELGCEIRGDKRAQSLDPRIIAATEDDWGTEYLSAIMSVKIVDTIDEAITHINHYGSHHTDAIISADDIAAENFMEKIDSAIVIRNASTQFADGGEFGLGAEIGIATGKLHARGPVGAEQLTTYKYQLIGNGQIRPL